MAYTRKPAKRENGKYVDVDTDQMESIAIETVEKLCEVYPAIDIIDINCMFERLLNYQFSRANLRESAVEL